MDHCVAIDGGNLIVHQVCVNYNGLSCLPNRMKTRQEKEAVTEVLRLTRIGSDIEFMDGENDQEENY